MFKLLGPHIFYPSYSVSFPFHPTRLQQGNLGAIVNFSPLTTPPAGPPYGVEHDPMRSLPKTEPFSPVPPRPTTQVRVCLLPAPSIPVSTPSGEVMTMAGVVQDTDCYFPYFDLIP